MSGGGGGAGGREGGWLFSGGGHGVAPDWYKLRGMTGNAEFTKSFLQTSKM